eukprot:6209852-Pleurochrysis_carterae.AAC.4
MQLIVKQDAQDHWDRAVLPTHVQACIHGPHGRRQRRTSESENGYTTMLVCARGRVACARCCAASSSPLGFQLCVALSVTDPTNPRHISQRSPSRVKIPEVRAAD